MAQAQAELNIITARLAREYADTNKEVTASIESIKEVYIKNVRQMMGALMGAVRSSC